MRTYSTPAKRNIILYVSFLRYTSPPASGELERATIVLATPPCSYTGIRDAVDLAVARGGDTLLLEALTDIDGGLRQPHTLLAEQLDTLRYALTRPNVQLLIYEAHSVLPAETTEMVEQVTQYANKMAVEKYIREHSVSLIVYLRLFIFRRTYL